MTTISFNDNQLESISILFDKSLLIQSTPAAGIYVYNCPYNVQISKYRVDTVCIPPTQYHVDDTNNQLVFTTTANGKMTATIEKGYYSSESDLLDAVDAAMTAASDTASGTDHTYTVTAGAGTNTVLGNIVIVQNSATLTVHGGDSSAAHLLGLSGIDVASSGVTYTGPEQIQVNGADAVSIVSNTFTSNKSYAGKRNGSIVTLPLKEPGAATTYVESDAAFIDLDSSQSLRELEVELRGSHGLPIQLQSSSPSIKMTFAVVRKPLMNYMVNV